MSYTKGPWSVVHNNWETSTVYSHDGSGVVAECPIDSGVDEQTQDHLEAEKEANARLISAAPDLLEALKSALVVIEGTDKVLHKHGFMQDIKNPVIPEMRAAISKATGA